MEERAARGYEAAVEELLNPETVTGADRLTLPTHPLAFITLMLAVAGALVLGLAACSKDADPSPTLPPTAAPVTPPGPVLLPESTETASTPAVIRKTEETPALPSVAAVTQVMEPATTPVLTPEPSERGPTWIEDGLNDLERSAVESLEAIETADEKTAETVLGLPWLADELTLEERLTLPRIEEIATEDGTLAQSVVELPWVADEITDGELLAVTSIRDIARKDTAVAQQVVEAPWVANGVTEEERLTLTLIQDAAEEDTALAQRILQSPEVPDVITREDPSAYTDLNNLYIQRFRQEFPEIARALFAHSWFNDGINKNEMWTISIVLRTAREDSFLAQQVSELPWVADGITANEWRGLSSISAVSAEDPVLARQLLGLPWIADGINEAERQALRVCWLLAGNDLGQTQLLLSQAWFQDDLTDEEAALLVTLKTGCAWNPFYRELIEGGHVRSEIFSLPSGEVKVYVVSRSPLELAGSHIFRSVREGIEAIEDFMGPPWVRSEVIVYLEPELQFIREVAGLNAGSHIIIRGVSEREWLNAVIYHELAHFYFGYRNSPRWLAEGGANFLEAYTTHFGLNVSMQEQYESARRGVAWSCLPRGVTKINDLLEATADLSSGEYLQSPLWTCTYPLGETFLLGMFNSIGHDAVSSAMRQLYQRGSTRYSRATEDEIFEAFLSNTPSEKQDEFQDVYHCLHGRPLPGYTGRSDCEVYTPVPTPVLGTPVQTFTPGSPTPTPTSIPTPAPAMDPAGIATDRAALVALYHATGGPDWLKNDNWLSEAALDQWYGVATDDSGRVTALDLHENPVGRHNTGGAWRPLRLTPAGSAQCLV